MIHPPELATDLAERYAGSAARFADGDLVRMLSLSSELESTGSLRRSPHPRLLVEMLLLRLSYLDRTVELEELLQGLGERGRGEGASPVGAGGIVARRPSRGCTRSKRWPRLPRSRAGLWRDRAPTMGTGAVSSGVDLVDAWAQVLASGIGVPAGTRAFLVGATVSEATPGKVRLSVPEGIAHERLGTASVRNALAGSLSETLGRKVTVILAPPQEGPRRTTREEARERRLEQLIEREPLLARAVEELDLELLD